MRDCWLSVPKVEQAVAEPAAGIICAPWNDSYDCHPFKKGACYFCDAAVAYDAVMHERLVRQHPNEEIVRMCEACAAPDMAVMSEEKLAAVRAEFASLRPELAAELDAISDDELRKFFANKKRPAQ